MTSYIDIRGLHLTASDGAFFFMLLFSTISAKIIYLIRHGEKPTTGNQLSEKGVDRSLCISGLVFGGNYPQLEPPKRIIAQPVRSHKSTRPIDTVKGLANQLNITIETKCDRDEVQCVYDSILTGNIGPVLVSWEHKVLGKIMNKFVPIKKPRQLYPSDLFNLIFVVDTDKNSYSLIHQSCEGYVEDVPFLASPAVYKPKCKPRQYI